MGLFKKKIDYFFIITGTIEHVIAEMRYSYLQIEKYIADKITSLCEKRDISKYRLSQFFQEGNSENLTEKQKEVLERV